MKYASIIAPYISLCGRASLDGDPEALLRSLMVLATRNDGARCYVEKLPQDSRTAPTADGGLIYFGGNSGHLYAIDIQAEGMKWNSQQGPRYNHLLP